MDTEHRILLVDNETGMLEVMSETLERLGTARVLVEQQPRRAAERLSDGEAFDLVITNLQMPGLSGMQLVRLAHARHPSMPILVVTGYSMPDTERRCREAGASGYLTKPFLPDDLLAEVRRLLAEGAGAPPPPA